MRIQSRRRRLFVATFSSAVFAFDNASWAIAKTVVAQLWFQDVDPPNSRPIRRGPDVKKRKGLTDPVLSAVRNGIYQHRLWPPFVPQNLRGLGDDAAKAGACRNPIWLGISAPSRDPRILAPCCEFVSSLVPGRVCINQPFRPLRPFLWLNDLFVSRQCMTAIRRL